MGATTIASAMDEDGWASIYESIAAFEDRPGGDARYFNRPDYVKPIITNLGNVLNSNWYVSANVPQSLAFEFGIPISLIPINDEDRVFNEKDATSTDEIKENANINNADTYDLMGRKTDATQPGIYVQGNVKVIK